MPLCQSSTPLGTGREITESLILQVKKKIVCPRRGPWIIRRRLARLRVNYFGPFFGHRASEARVCQMREMLNVEEALLSAVSHPASGPCHCKPTLRGWYKVGKSEWRWADTVLHGGTLTPAHTPQRKVVSIPLGRDGPAAERWSHLPDSV